MILPYRAIENVTTKKSNLTTTYSLIVTIRGQEELFFEFRDQDSRDECAALLHKMIETARSMADSSLMNPEERIRVEAAKAEHALLNRIRRSSRDHVNVVLPATAGDEANDGALIYDEYEGDNTDSPGKHPGSLRIKCLTIGSRGDVQPFIALCKGLKADGHIVTICTHAEFGPWIESHGIAFAPVAGDPAQLMRLCVEHDMFSASFFKEAWVNVSTSDVEPQNASADLFTSSVP
jgi:sterol 3beta-glucosyltransferase